MNWIAWAQRMIALRLRVDDDGQALVEYAFVLLFVAIVAAAGLSTIGPIVSDMFTDVVASFP